MSDITIYAAPSQANMADAIPRRQLIAFLAMCFGMFMAFLDIQIVSSSLNDIQAGLSASADEIPWVQTAYLIAEVIAIPLSGFLSRALGTRILFAGCAAGFTLASVMCGTSSSIDSMIVWRALQGFIGGGMVPTVFASAYVIFQGPRQKFVAPVVGLIATLAPTIGPTVGGYLTDAFSWHWLFFINVVPGIVVTIATVLLVDFDKPDFALLKNFDWTGLLRLLNRLRRVTGGPSGKSLPGQLGQNLARRLVLPSSKLLSGQQDILRDVQGGAHASDDSASPLPISTRFD